MIHRWELDAQLSTTSPVGTAEIIGASEISNGIACIQNQRSITEEALLKIEALLKMHDIRSYISRDSFSRPYGTQNVVVCTGFPAVNYWANIKCPFGTEIVLCFSLSQ